MVKLKTSRIRRDQTFLRWLEFSFPMETILHLDDFSLPDKASQPFSTPSAAEFRDMLCRRRKSNGRSVFVSKKNYTTEKVEPSKDEKSVGQTALLLFPELRKKICPFLYHHYFSIYSSHPLELASI